MADQARDEEGTQQHSQQKTSPSEEKLDLSHERDAVGPSDSETAADRLKRMAPLEKEDEIALPPLTDETEDGPLRADTELQSYEKMEKDPVVAALHDSNMTDAPWYILLPHRWSNLLWDLIVLLCTALVLTYYPYRIGP